MAHIYVNARRARIAAIEQAIPVSLVRRGFILAVVASACPNIDTSIEELPRFEDVAGKADLRIHDTLMAWEARPFAHLKPAAAMSAMTEVVLLRERIMRPYGKMTISSAVMTTVGILSWLIQNDLYSLEDKPSLLEVIEEVRTGVRDIDPKLWDATERGTLRAATFILADLAREGFGFGVTEQEWREAFNG